MSKRLSGCFSIKVAARGSALSKKQVQEVLEELRRYHPQVTFECQYVTTTGDKDRTTSLRMLERTDFFTKEIDQLVLEHKVSVGIHSAKDLPDPLPKGLTCIALTKGIDPSDVLVFRDPNQVKIIATSSIRRQQMAAAIYPNAQFVDIRGTIEERLFKLQTGEIDALVVAEAALIRLGLTHLKRIRLEGETACGQGRLAIIGREDDKPMQQLFNSLIAK